MDKDVDYKACLDKPRKGTLCPRGYCTAKFKYKVYPSAYANGYAVSVCKGKQPDYIGQTRDEGSGNGIGLQRWYQEKWVNICDKQQDGYAPCGRPQASLASASYPYCRPLYKLPGTTVKTVDQLSEADRIRMCRNKRKQRQPSRVVLQGGGSGGRFPIPEDVRKAAKLGLTLLDNGFQGGTKTGWDRAIQLSGNSIDLDSLADMRTWFARHGPDASNGGTSYPGYLKWQAAGSPMQGGAAGYRGAVAWLIWGGDPAYLWLKSEPIRTALEMAFPHRRAAVKENNLKMPSIM